MAWKVGKREFIGPFRWYLDGSEVTGGTATAKIFVDDGGNVTYLQSDLLTLSTTVANISATYIAAIGWTKEFTVPTALDGYSVHIEITHSDASLPKLKDGPFYVTIDDLDDVEGGGGGGGSGTGIDIQLAG